MKWLHIISFILVIVGAINWGLVGLFGFNLVSFILGTGMLANLIYVLVGLGGIYLIFTHAKDCKACSMKMKKR